MKSRKKVLSLVWCAASCLALGCSDDGDAGAATDGDGSSSSGGSATDSASGPSTATATTTTTTTTSDDMSTGMDSAGFINPETTGDSGPSGPQPNGSQCGTNAECESEYCYQVPMVGGVCSECLMDADCGTGTCSLDLGMLYAVCTDGSAGNMCDSDEGCMGDLVCTELIDTGGLFNLSFCSECGPTAPCDMGTICSPQYDAMGFSGTFNCVEPASVESGQGCPLDNGVGDGSVCADGFCEPVDVFMGFVQLGICGECIEDTDCPMGMMCMGGTAGQDGLSGATCI